VGHSVNIYDLQRVVVYYFGRYNLFVAAGPLAAALLIRAFSGNRRWLNRLADMAVAGSCIWFAALEIPSSMLHLITSQFDHLESMFTLFRV
jgi:hypothetical protein